MDILRRIPLSALVLGVVITVGLLVGAVLDQVQTRTQARLFDEYLAEQLKDEAAAVRREFDSYVVSYSTEVSLLAGQKGFLDHLKGLGAQAGNKVRIYNDDLPVWMPAPDVMRHFAPVTYALLSDSKGALRELYTTEEAPVPLAFLSPSNLMRAMSHNQSFMTTVAGLPYLMTSIQVEPEPGQEPLGHLMLVARLDNEFMLNVKGRLSGRGEFALVTQESPRVVASSNPDQLPPGRALRDLEGDYEVMGKSFFDLGSSDLSLQIVSFLSRAEVEAMGRSLLRSERSLRLIMGVSVLLSLAVLTYWLAGRIRQTVNDINSFSLNTLGLKPVPGTESANELVLLGERFRALAAEVLESRDRLRRQSEAMLREKTAYLDNFLHTATLAVVATDMDFRVKYINDVAETLTGMTASEALGSGIRDLKCPCLVEPHLSEALEAVRAGREHVWVVGEGARHIETRCAQIVDDSAGALGYLFLSHDVTERVRASEALEKYAEELKDALSKVKVLSGMIPICVSCKKIRSDKNYWQQIEDYVSKHTDAKFSHGVCPDCALRLYPELFKDKQELKED